MYKILFFVIIAILLPFQYFGVFNTLARSSTDLFFSPQQEKTGNITVVSLEGIPDTATAERLIELIEKGNPSVIGLVFTGVFLDEKDNVVNLAVINQEHIIDNDGKIRSTICENSFALEVARKINPEINCFSDPMTINYSLTGENVEIVTFPDLEAGKVTASPIVLVGLNFESDNVLSTPLTGIRMSELFVTTNAVNTLVTENQMVLFPEMWALGLSVIVYLIFGIALIKLKFLRGLVVLIFFVALYLLGVWYLFLNNILLDFFYIPIGLGFIYIILLQWGYVEQNKSKTYIQKAFGKYLNKKVMDELLKDPEKLKLGGERKVITIMFVDIKSFTKISESTRTDRLVGILNKFLSFVTDTVIQEDGTLDKYVGDEVIAFWNAPLDQADHAILAANAAIKIDRGLEKIVKGGVGIGLNTGIAFVGNVGSSYLYDYTAIGDAVNITSRLEQLTRTYGIPMIASEAFVKTLKLKPEGENFQFRKLDILNIKAKSHPNTIYELVGYQSEITEEKINLIRSYEYALYLYHDDKYQEAEEILVTLHGDPPSQYLLGKIGELKKHKLELEPEL